MSRIIAGGTLVTTDGIVTDPVITLDEDGLVSSLRRKEPGEQLHPSALVFPEAVLAPAYLDVHIHGCAGYDVMQGTTESMDAICRFLTQHGVGAFLPTTVTSPEEQMLTALSALSRQIEAAERSPRPGAVPLGIHLEGPFLSHRRRGVHPESLLVPPTVETFERFWQAAEGRISLMTIAPELPGALDLIRHASALGVRCSLGHTDATWTQAQEGHRAGAVSATHTFNAMRPLAHRDPGVIGFVLDESSVYAEIIADGHHVDPAIVRLLYKAKGPTRTLLVTDGMSAAGMPDGHYKLGGLDVEVVDGKCMSDGAIAGSTLTLDRGVRNFAEFTGVPLATAVQAASRNPAGLLGEDDGWGKIEEGRPAHLVALTPQGHVIETFVRGVPQIHGWT